MRMHKWFVYDEFDAASKAAADFIASEIISCLEIKTECHIALPGGNSPKQCLTYLSMMKLPWYKVHWYLGDERCCPVGHEDRNDVMLEKYLWSKISDTNIHQIPAELGADKAAEEYRKTISTVEQFDVVFLGVGEDGHTASLFPGNKGLYDHRTVIPIFNSPKPPSERVSLSLDTLLKSHSRIVLTSTKAKTLIIERIKKGEELPINCIGDINWFID